MQIVEGTAAISAITTLTSPQVYFWMPRLTWRKSEKSVWLPQTETSCLRLNLSQLSAMFHILILCFFLFVSHHTLTFSASILFVGRHKGICPEKTPLK